MKPITTEENPYASPQTCDIAESADVLLRATTRMYRGIGWAGIGCCLLAYSILMASELTTGTLDWAEFLVGTTGIGLYLAFFVFVLKTASRLETRFDRTYRRARWLGILVATIFFPVLTWPGIVAVRRLERYRRFTDS